jgi:DNA polymerase-3 subunit epsilon
MTELLETYAETQASLIEQGEIEEACILTLKYVKLLTGFKSQGSLAMENATRFLLEQDKMTRADYDALNLARWKRPEQPEYLEAQRVYQSGKNVPSEVKLFFDAQADVFLKGQKVSNEKAEKKGAVVDALAVGGDASAPTDGRGGTAVSKGARSGDPHESAQGVPAPAASVAAAKTKVSPAKTSRSAQAFVVRAPATFLGPDAFMGNGEGRHLVFLDFETNGLHDCSVLSATALCVTFYNGAFIMGRLFNRFYFPKEKYNSKAVAINKLAEWRLKELRAKSTYVRYFENDRDWEQVCSWGDVFIAHNIAFDRKFMRHDPNCVFCTMLSNASELKLSRRPRTNEWKWPKLRATAAHYNIPIRTELLHFGYYDTWLCFSIFQAMYQQENPSVRSILGAADAKA